MDSYELIAVSNEDAAHLRCVFRFTRIDYTETTLPPDCSLFHVFGASRATLNRAFEACRILPAYRHTGSAARRIAKDRGFTVP